MLLIEFTSGWTGLHPGVREALIYNMETGLPIIPDT